MSLVGKTVKIDEDNKHLIAFFYPDYVMRDYLAFWEAELNVIYTGSPKPDLKASLAIKTKNFISLTAEDNNYDVDLNNRANLLEFVYRKWDYDFKEVLSKDTQKYLFGISYEDFLNYIKTYWVLGYSELDSWPIIDINSLISQTNDKELYKKVISLIETYNEKYIEACVFNYLKSHLKKFDNKKLSKLLTKYRVQEMCMRNKLILFLSKLTELKTNRI